MREGAIYQVFERRVGRERNFGVPVNLETLASIDIDTLALAYLNKHKSSESFNLDILIPLQPLLDNLEESAYELLGLALGDTTAVAKEVSNIL